MREAAVCSSTALRPDLPSRASGTRALLEWVRGGRQESLTTTLTGWTPNAWDLDLLYVLDPSSALGPGINRLEDELTELFGRRVDLVAEKALHPM